MDIGCSKNGEACPQLLDLMISQEKGWHVVKKEDHERSHGCSEEKKLELRLGPPGEYSWYIKNNHLERDDNDDDQSLLSFGYFSLMNNNASKQPHNKFPSPDQDHRVGSVLSTPWAKNHHQHHQAKPPPFLQFPSSSTAPPSSSLPVVSKESSQPCCTKAVDLQNADKKPFSTPANTAMPPPNCSQKRTAPGLVVGWPPIRSFRKNLATSSSSKVASESSSEVPHKVADEKSAAETSGKGLFVKINMDGVPIGRKVDLKACDSYEKLSIAVDELFKGLLSAQRDSSAGGIVNNKQEEETVISGVLDGSGEYTLVYEDNEGDRTLVGDVPWHMFASTVKRLRVLKSSELSALSFGSCKQQRKIPA